MAASRVAIDVPGTHKTIPRPPRTPSPPTPATHDIPSEYSPVDNLSLAPEGNRYSWASLERNNSAYSVSPPRALNLRGSPQGSLRGSGSPQGSPTRTPRMSVFTNVQNGGTATMTMKQPKVPNAPTINRSPFNFQSVAMAPPTKGATGQQPIARKGHKYKRSSVSHQIFLEPPVRAPLALPASLPIPTFRECKQSMSKEQRWRLAWCGCHAMIAGFILWHGRGSLAITALSHLILFDAIGATLCVVVDVLSNFEVWKRSSLRHPFGLERAEVLAGFAMSVFLLFMGFDLISHSVQDLIQSWAGEEEHGHVHHHNHQRILPGSIDISAVAAIAATLVSALLLKNHVRIGKAMRLAAISSLPSVLSNPSHLLTLSCSTILLILPLLSISMWAWLDRCLSLTIALSMITLGVRLVKSLGSMLLMRYGADGVPEVIKEIEQDPAITSIEESAFWQVHHGLCMANLKLHVSTSEAHTEGKIRDRVTRLIKDRLGGVYGDKTQQRWDVTIQCTVGN